MKSIYQTYILLLLFFLVPWRESYSQTVSLTYPNGGEVIHAATTIDIEWNYINVDNILIEFSTNGGFDWDTIIASVPSSTLKYAWKVPPVESDSCMVRITDILGGAQDESDGYFSIPEPTINWVYPNEPGIVFQTNTVEGIEWATPDVDDVMIEYSLDNGSNWEVITESVDGFWRYYNWVIPDTLTNQGLLRITSNFNNEIFHVSEHPFSIEPLPQSTAAKYKGGSYDGNAKRSANEDFITLTHPVGGETWTTNSTQNITWDYENVEDISIDISYDGGSNWINLIESYPASAKQFSWTVVGQTSENCKVRVKDIRTGVENITPDVFTIPPPQLTIVFPHDGDTIFTETIEGVEWLGEDIPSVSVHYSFDGGNTWHAITDSVPGRWNYYNWVVPDQAQENVLLKIADIDNPGVVDVLESGFTIATLPTSTPAKYRGGSYDGYTTRSTIADSLQVLSPNGGEVFISSQTYPIEWTYNNVDNLKIEFSYDNGNTWSVVTPSVPASALKYDWTVPSQPSQYCKIRLTSLDNTAIIDESDEVFTIPSPTVSILYPTSGEVLKTTTIESIEWESLASESVRIEFSEDGGQTWSMVDENVNGHWGYYNWVVPDTISNNCLLRITDNQDDDFQAMHTEPFSIEPLEETTPAKFRGGSYDGYSLNIFLDQHLLVRKPNGWEAYLANEEIPIRWTYLNIDGNMRIDVTQDNEQTWETIASGIPVEQETYTWTGGREASSWNKIRLVHETGLWQDKSDNFFIVGEMGELSVTEVSNFSNCAGNQIDIAFDTNESYGPDNIFIAQLSGPDGTFSNQSDSLGMLAGTGSGIIQATIPDSLPGSENYRIRVVSTDPPIIGTDNGTDIPINALPQVDLGEDTILCEGNTLTLDPGLNESGTVNWSTGETTPTLEVSGGGIYYVDVYNACGLATDTIEVVYRELPGNNLPETVTMCAGSSTTLNAYDSEAVTYQWSSGQTTPSVNVNETGVYTVTLSNACGTVDYSVNVEMTDNPVVDLGEDFAICGEEEVTLSAPEGYASYLWSTGSEQQQITISQAGYYSVTVTDDNGCEGTDHISAQKFDLPELTITGETEISQGEESQLTASEGFVEYIWSTGENGNSINVSETGTYTVDAYDINGCMASQSITVNVTGSDLFTLTLETTGSGTVNVDNNAYISPLTSDAGTRFALEALSDEGWKFINWSGGIESANASETVTLNSDLLISALFGRIGDVNLDQSINVTDVVMIVSHILESEPQNFYEILADVNQDEMINITDVVADVNIILYDNIYPPGKSVASENAFIAMEDGAISLESDGTITALQFEFMVDEGHQAELELMKEDLQLAYSQKENKVKGVIFSTSNATIPSGLVPLVMTNAEDQFMGWGRNIASNYFAESVEVQPMEITTDIATHPAGEFHLNLFPNPSHGNFNLRISTFRQISLEVQLHDVSGRIVLQDENMIVEPGVETLNFGASNLGEGVYFLKVTATDPVSNQPLFTRQLKIMTYQ